MDQPPPPGLRSVLRDTAQTLANTIGLGPQVDVLLDEKYSHWRQYYRGPVLDFGAGSGFFSRFLSNQGLEVTAVDVVDECRYPEVQVTRFDPPVLPFPDRAFATSVAHFVFHHVDDQDAAFEELVRVTRGTIIVSEDVVDTRWDRTLAKLHTGSSPWSQAWDSFRSTKGWLDFFQKYPVEVVSWRSIPRWRTPFYPIRRAVYVLQVTNREACSDTK